MAYIRNLNNISYCMKCFNVCSVNTRTEIDYEPYGERLVPREAVFEESDCCGYDCFELNHHELLDYLTNIAPVHNTWTHDEDGTWARYTGDIDDLEQCVLLNYFGSDRFTIKATKNGDKPTEDEREAWSIYEWIEELMNDQCNYNTTNFTEWHVRVEDNQIKVRWIL